MRKVFLGLLLAFSFPLFASSSGIRIYMREGNAVWFSFDQNPTLKVKNSNLLISVNGMKCVSYPYANVERVQIIGGASIPQSNSKQDLSFNLASDLLSVTGLSTDEPVELYSVDDRLLLSLKADTMGKASADLSLFQQDEFIVRVLRKGITYKLFTL